MSSPEDARSTSEFVHELTSVQPELRAFVRYLMMGTEGAADVLQEVNVLLWEKRGEFEPGTNFRAWAFTSARYVSLGHRRKEQRQGMTLFEPEMVDRLADEWEAEADDHEHKLNALQKCVSRLPAEDQSLLQARYSKHGDVERMARVKGRSGSGLRARLFRLRAALKQCVMEQLKLEGGLS